MTYRLINTIRNNSFGLFGALGITGTTLSKKSKKDKNETINDENEKDIKNTNKNNNFNLFNPIITKYSQPISVGIGLGFCAGYASKKIGKAVAGCIGVGFIIGQYLQYQGWIDIHWNKIANSIEQTLDQDGDGDFDMDDIKILKQRYMHLLTYSLASTAGFSSGFVTGFKFG